MRDKLSARPAQLPSGIGVVARVGFVVGALLLLWSGYLHLHLWLDFGYRHVPTIGPLFLFQAITGLVLATLIVRVRRVWTALLGIVFAASTMTGFLVSIHDALFGFKDSWSAPFAQQAFAIEVASAVVLFATGALCLSGSGASPAAATRSRGLPSTRA
jgi:hypothetical protein